MRCYLLWSHIQGQPIHVSLPADPTGDREQPAEVQLRRSFAWDGFSGRSDSWHCSPRNHHLNLRMIHVCPYTVQLGLHLCVGSLTPCCRRLSTGSCLPPGPRERVWEPHRWNNCPSAIVNLLQASSSPPPTHALPPTGHRVDTTGFGAATVLLMSASNIMHFVLAKIWKHKYTDRW